MPKIHRHTGPTHKGDPPKPSRRSFGEALRAARAGQDVPPADDPAPTPVEQVTVTLDVTQADERLRHLMRQWVRTDGGGPVAYDQAPADGVPTNGGWESAAVDGERSGFGDLVTAEGGTSGNQAEPDATDVQVTTEPEGGEQPSPGTSSSTSPKRRRTSSDEPKQTSRRRARLTESRSSQDPEAGSTAGSAVEQTTTSGSDE